MTDFTCDDCVKEDFSHYEMCGFVNVYGICFGQKEKKNEGEK